jgi:hypothetical protein
MSADALFTVLLSTRSYLVTAEEAAKIRSALREGRKSIEFDALKCCGDCPEGTVRVDEDVAQVRGLISHQAPAGAGAASSGNVVPLFR